MNSNHIKGGGGAGPSNLNLATQFQLKTKRTTKKS